MNKPINWYDRHQEFEHRHTKPVWMNSFKQHQWEPEQAFLQGTDNRLRWQINHRKLPAWWRWHTESIEYRFNSEGFRNDQDFADMDWPQSHVVLGSSAITGDGVPVTESIPHYIQQITDRPVINVGVSGGSVEVVFNNVVKMVHDHGVPKGVHIMWPEPVRQLDDLQLVVTAQGPEWHRSDVGPWNAKREHIRDAKPFYRRNLYQHAVRQLLRGAVYSEIFEGSHRVVPGETGHYDHNTKLSISTQFPDHVMADPKHADRPWSEWSESTHKWYYNHYMARDVDDREPNPVDSTHQGGFFNRAVADYLIRTQQML